MALRDAGGEILWELYFNGGSNNYSSTGGETPIGWTDAGLDIAFTVTSPGSYHVVIHPDGGSPHTQTGILNAAATQFRAWSFSNGTSDTNNPMRDYFFDHLSITAAGGATTSATVIITRAPHGDSDSNGDGIPDAWYIQYGFNPTGPSIAHLDSDGDGATNWEEFIADTHPNNPSSVFPPRIQQAHGSGTFSFQVGPPTSPARRYDVFWSTNLVGGQWHPVGLNHTGHAQHNAITLTVTNAPPDRYYRTGVVMPQ